MNLFDRSRKPVGKAQVRLSADFDQHLGGEVVEQDPLNLNHLEKIMPGERGKSMIEITTGSRPHSRLGNGNIIILVIEITISYLECCFVIVRF